MGVNPSQYKTFVDNFNIWNKIEKGLQVCWNFRTFAMSNEGTENWAIKDKNCEI